MFLAGLAYVTPVRRCILQMLMPKRAIVEHHLQGGQFILTLIDYYGGGFIIFIFTILEVLAINWVYGKKYCGAVNLQCRRNS